MDLFGMFFTDEEKKDKSVVDWRKCDSEQIWNDISFAVAALHGKFMGAFNPNCDPFTVEISPDNYKCLSKKDLMGNAVIHYFFVNWRHVMVAEGSPFSEKCFSVTAIKDGRTYTVRGLRTYRD